MTYANARIVASIKFLLVCMMMRGTIMAVLAVNMKNRHGAGCRMPCTMMDGANVSCGTDGVYGVMGGVLFDTPEEAILICIWPACRRCSPGTARKDYRDYQRWQNESSVLMLWT